jgi:hypothetical protein
VTVSRRKIRCCSRKVKPCECNPFFNFDCICDPPTAQAPISHFGSHFTAGNISQFDLNNFNGTVQAYGPNATELIVAPTHTAFSGDWVQQLLLRSPGLARTVNLSDEDFCLCASFQLLRRTIAPGGSQSQAEFRIRLFNSNFGTNISFSTGPTGANFITTAVSPTATLTNPAFAPIDFQPHTLKICSQLASRTITFDLDNGATVWSAVFPPGTYPQGNTIPEIFVNAENSPTSIGSVVDVVMDEYCLAWGQAS